MQAMIRRLLVTLVTSLLATQVANLPAQTFSTLHRFTNSEGSNPAAILCLSSNILFGATSGGGAWGWGSLFAVGTDGNGFKTLHSFTPMDQRTGTNSDGVRVGDRLILSGEFLYGIAGGGGYFGNGTLFKLRTDGTDFTNLYHLVSPSTTNAGRSASIIISGDVIYGTAASGGDFGVGMIFRINLDGTGFTNLHSFLAPSDFQGLRTNVDGVSPSDGLTASGGTIYGTALKGGPLGFGTVFKLATNGTDFAVLHAFSGWDIGSDGDGPYGLLLSGKTLYGTTLYGSTFGNGTIFAIGTNGISFTTLHVFTSNGNNYYLTNADGASPNPGLILADDTLYGTTLHAGPKGAATVFAVNTNGTVFTVVHAFDYGGNYDTSNTIQVYTNADGLDPVVGLTLSSDALYGTTYDGGTSGGGTVFRISFRPSLTFMPSITQAVLSWPASYGGFDYTGFGLQLATNLNSATVWAPVGAGPVLTDGKYTTTNPVSGTQRFYRLSR